ncbi:hypothetical protein D3C73_1292470 [compost metagenome]
MQAESVHHFARFPHDYFRPVVIIHIGPAGDLVDPVVAIVSDIGLITPVQICIIFRAHIAAAAPVLIADAKIFQRPRLLPPVLPPPGCHRRFAVKGHVLDPF